MSTRPNERTGSSAARSLSCGCWQQPCPEHGGRIHFDEIEENAELIRNALRKLDALDPDATAASEALGFFIYKARKEATAGV